MKLRVEGRITIQAGEEDERSMWIKVSKLGLRYFSLDGFKHEVQHGITIDETPLQAF